MGVVEVLETFKVVSCCIISMNSFPIVSFQTPFPPPSATRATTTTDCRVADLAGVGEYCMRDVGKEDRNFFMRLEEIATGDGGETSAAYE